MRRPDEGKSNAKNVDARARAEDEACQTREEQGDERGSNAGVVVRGDVWFMFRCVDNAVFYFRRAWADSGPVVL